MFKRMSLLALLFSASLAQAKEPFKMIRAGELAQMITQKDPKLSIYDANNGETREKYGIIPGAKLLSSSNKYDAAKELPTDKTSKLVFYCGNTKCMASHDAARKAAKAGYKDVAVMSDGIIGWKDAGHETAKP